MKKISLPKGRPACVRGACPLRTPRLEHNKGPSFSNALIKGIILVLLAAVILMGMVGCNTKTSGNEEQGEQALDLNALTLDELTTKAKEEGEVQSVGMPDDWANWGQTWSDINSIYGLTHDDVDMSSAEELALFEAEKANATKDIGDVGEAFGPIAVERGLTNPYKTSYWDSIPDWAKDDEGHWIIAYYGTMSILTNADLVNEIPKSFNDIKNGDSIGNVTTANQAQMALLAAAKAFGGSESNIQPGLDFFRELAETGRLDLGDQTPARMEKGEIAVCFLWDYNALGYRDQFLVNNPTANFVVHIPEAAVQSGYTTGL